MSESPNAAQIEYWNDVSGPKWVALDDQIDKQIAPIGDAAIEAAAVGEGDRVIDIGCGCGNTTREIARRAKAGRVVGLDISGPMLARARERAKEAGLDHLEFEQADAQVYPFVPGETDLAFSRFGVMFFADPVAAFANIGRALAPEGRVVFACWQGIGENPWMRIPIAAAASAVELGGALPDPNAPGPFAFADRERVSGILRDAGFGEVSVEPILRTLSVGEGLGFDETIDFVLQLGPVGAALRERDEATRVRAAEAVRDALEPYREGDTVRLDAAAWLVRASEFAG